jgi:hypothetical protein
VVDSSRATCVENGGDDDDSGYDYAPAAWLSPISIM